jgi:hypothetical protein
VSGASSQASSTIGSIAFTLVALKAQSLRSTLCLIIESDNLLVELLVFRFRWTATAPPLHRFLSGKFCCFSQQAQPSAARDEQEAQSGTEVSKPIKSGLTARRKKHERSKGKF